MIRFLDCLVDDHDWRLVVPAVAVCVLSTFVTFWLYRWMRSANGRSRLGWGVLTALVGATGTWATHFVAMMAFHPLFDVAYDLPLTALSLVLAFVVMGSALALVVAVPGRAGQALSGLMFGVGIGAMHYSGMRAFMVAGHLSWDFGPVAASLASGMAFGAAAMLVAGDGSRMGRLLSGAGLMVLAIAGLHFVGMSALTVAFDPTVVVPHDGISNLYLANCVAMGAGAILVCGAACMVIEARAGRDGDRRLRDLAEAAVEGIAICREGRVEDANGSFCKLVGQPLEAIRGRCFDGLFDAAGTMDSAIDGQKAVEAVVRVDEGDGIPVSVVARRLGARHAGRRVFAVRDLREQREAEGRIRFLATTIPSPGSPTGSRSTRRSRRTSPACAGAATPWPCSASTSTASSR
jgi:NO-binding membrane sensor protein with MHYT domain